MVQRRTKASSRCTAAPRRDGPLQPWQTVGALRPRGAHMGRPERDVAMIESYDEAVWQQCAPMQMLAKLDSAILESRRLPVNIT